MKQENCNVKECSNQNANFTSVDHAFITDRPNGQLKYKKRTRTHTTHTLTFPQARTKL